MTGRWSASRNGNTTAATNETARKGRWTEAQQKKKEGQEPAIVQPIPQLPTSIVSSPTVRPAVARQQTPVQQMPVQAPTQAEPTPGIHFDLNQTPYFQSTAPKSRLQQLAEETVQLAEETAQQRAFTPITPTTSYRDNSAFTRYEIPNAETSAFRKITPVEQPKEEPRHDFSKSDEQVMADRKQAALQVGINWDELNALQRGAGTVAATVSGAGKQAAASALGVGAAIYNENTKSGQILAWQNADTTAREMLQRLKDGEDASDLEYRLKSQAAYYGGPEYADRLINYVREKAAAGEEDINIDDAEPIKDYIFSRQQENIQGLYNTMNNLSTSGAQDLQTAKYLNLIQSDFGDKLVDAGAFAVQSAVDASIAAALHLTGTSAAYIPFALRAFGGSYNEALTNMQNMGQVIGSDAATKAAQYGTAAAGIEVATEMLWGMAGAMGAVKKGALDDQTMQAIGNAIAKLADSEAGRQQLRKISEFALGGVFEGVEEVVGDLLSYVLNTAGIYDQTKARNSAEDWKRDWEETGKELWNSFAGGALSGWMGSGARAAINPVVQRQTGNKLKSGTFEDYTGAPMTAADLVENAGAAEEGTELANTLQDLIRKYGQDGDYSSVLQKATDTELGRLYEAYENTTSDSFRSQQLVHDAINEADARRSGKLPTSYARNIVKNEMAMQELANLGYEIDNNLSYKEKIDDVKSYVETLAEQQALVRELSNQQNETKLDEEAVNALREASKPTDISARSTASLSLDRAAKFGNTQNWQQTVANNAVTSAQNDIKAMLEANKISGLAAETIQAQYQFGQDTQKYFDEMNSAVQGGREGRTLKSVGTPQTITIDQQRNAFRAGRAEFNQEAENARLRLRESGERNDGQSAGEQTAGLAEGTGRAQEGQRGTVSGKKGLKRLRKESLSRESLATIGLVDETDSPRQDIRDAKEYVTSKGMNFVAWSGGAMYFEGERYGVRGFYDPKTNTVYVRTDHEEITAGQIARHEATHGDIHNGKVRIGTARGNSTEVEFGTVRDALIKTLGGVKQLDDLLDKYVAAYRGTGLSEQDVWEELVCDAMGDMNELAYRGHGEDARKIAVRMQQVKDATAANYNPEGKNKTPASGKSSREMNQGPPDAFMPRTVEEQKSWYNGTDMMYGIEPNGVKFSLDSMAKDILEAKFQKDLKTKLGWSAAKVDAFVDNLNSLMEYIKPNRDILDMNESYTKENRPYSPYKPNSDPLYKISLDYSTLCRKRLMTQYIIEKLQLREHRPMSGEEQIAIRDMLKEYREIEDSLQVACAMCYVEAARLKSPDQMNRYFENPEPILKNYFAQKNKAYKRKVDDLQKKWKTDHGYAADATKSSMSPADVTAFNEYSGKIRREYDPARDQTDAKRRKEEIEAIERAKTLSPDNYLSAENLANLKENDPLVYTAYTSHIRAATRSKGLETDVPYYYGDSRRKGGPSDKFIRDVNAENGMRFSSWSDFQFIHLLDQMMAIVDLSVRGAAMHGYTKFPEQVRIFGKTGAMFNMSGVSGGTGFNPDGSLYFSPTESINFEEAKKLRDEFPETAGLQCIGINEAHTRALLRSDYIDYVIPYHVSGLNATPRKMAGISNWKDYTAVQEERVIDPNDKRTTYKWHKAPVFSEFFDKNWYNDPKYKGNGVQAMRDAAKRYVQMCAERGLRPKFEEYLNEDNYWKLLIDRKMVNQITGDLIQQRAVTPDFDFDTIRNEIGTYVENTRKNQGIEDRALKYITDHWDELPGRIETLKKEGAVEKTIAKAEANEKVMREMEHKANILGNEMYAAASGKASQDIDSDGNQLTEAQAEYFKDSKVRDKDGNLLVMYHGTNNEDRFTVFENGHQRHRKLMGEGFYFTSKEERAAYYGTKNMYKVYLNIKNPIDMAPGNRVSGTLLAAAKKYYGKRYDEMVKWRKARGLEVSSTRNEYVNGRIDQRIIGVLEDMTDVDTGADVNDYTDENDYLFRAKKIADILKSHGYDGAVWGDQYLALYPEQIKNTDNKSPTSSPDIRFSRDFATVEELYAAATPVQKQLNKMLREISNDLGFPYSDVTQKSISSINKKIKRKNDLGKKYSMMDMKDHTRSNVMMNDWTDIPKVLDAFDERGIPYETEAVVNNWGYKGFHTTWRNEDGIASEVQLTTKEHWPLKLWSDSIYDKWRDVTNPDAELTAEEKKQLIADRDLSRERWSQFEMPDLSPYERKSLASRGRASINSDASAYVTGTDFQTPPTSSLASLPSRMGDRSNTRPSSVTQKSDIAAPPLSDNTGTNPNNNISDSRNSVKTSRELGETELAEQNRQLREDLSELRQQLKQKTESRDYWRGQTKTTDGRRLRTDDINRLAGELIKSGDSAAEKAEIGKQLKDLGEYILNTTDNLDLLQENARMKSYEIAHAILDNSNVLREKGGDGFYQDFRDRLKATKVYVPQSVRNELAVDDWNKWRLGLSGTVTLTADPTKGKSIDQLYQDLMNEFGEWLLPADITSEADELNQILKVIDTYQPIYENRNSYEMAEAVEWMSNEILTRVIGDGIRETQPTYADRMEKKLANQKAKQQAAMKQVRQQRDQAVQNLKAHYQAMAADKRFKRADSEARSKLLRIASRLNNKKLSRVQRELLDRYIGDLDLVSKGITGKTIHDLQGLQNWYNAYKKHMGENFIPDRAIEDRLDRLTKRRISDMTQEEVADLTLVLQNFENMVRTENELIESQIKHDVYAAGQRVIEDIKNSRGRTGFLNKYISTETATPEREAHRLTGYNDTDPLYVATKELSDGQRKALDYQMRAEDLFDEWVNNRSFIRRIAGKHAQEIEVPAIVDGERTNVVITPAMRMSLYLHEKNDDNMTHITKGGVSIPDMKLYKKGKIEKAYEQATLAVFTRGMIREIASKMSPEEKAFADAVYRYYNGMSRDAINEVSELLKGYSLAGVENYYPIDTDGTFLSKEFDAIKRDGSIEGMGMLKERIQGATTPIMLYDMNDTLAKSIQQHSKYYGLAIPVRNFQKLYNANAFANRESDYEYDPLDRTDWRYDTSVIKTLQREWGSAATRYLEKMIADVSNGTGLKRDVWGELMSRARSRYAGAVLTTNASVAFKQAASYPTAAAVVGYGPLMKALKDRNSKVNLDLVKKYTPLLDYRMKGFSSPELGDIGKEGRHIPKALNWIQAMDVWTTRKLWLAAEYYVRENTKLERGSDAYYKEVATIYNRIIEETQPNYTMMQRPQILRSESDLTRALNMFRTQPFQNFNILYDAFWNMDAKTRQYKAAGTKEALNNLKEARKNFARTVSSQAVSAFVFALMQFAWDAFRGKDKKYRDEDGELKLESWLKGIGINVLSSVGGMVPFGGYVVELGEAAADAISKALDHGAIFDQTFYGLSENASDAWNDMGKAVISLITKTTNALGGKASTETTIRGVVDAIGDVGQFFGIPANNAVKTAQAIARNVFLATDGQYIGGYEALRVTTDPAKYTSDYYDLLYKAYTNDPAAYATIKKMMLNDNQTKNGSDVFTEEKINNAMRDRKKAQMDRDAAYKAQYEAITSNRLWDQADAKQKDAAMNRLTQYYMQTVGLGNDTGADLEAKIAGGEQYGLTSAEYILYKLALSMADEDGNGSYKNEEVTNAINMVPGLSNQEKAYLWDAQGKNAKSNPWK